MYRSAVQAERMVDGWEGLILKSALKFSVPSKPAAEQSSGQSPSIFSHNSVEAEAFRENMRHSSREYWCIIILCAI